MRRVLQSLSVALATGSTLAVALTGCGSSTTATPTSLTKAVRAAATAPAPTTASTTTSSSATPSTTTTSTTTTSTTASTTTTLSQLLPGTGRPSVVIGDQNYTEQFILGELYELALTAEGFSVTLNQNIGATSVSIQAMKDGTLDVYPEYLNVFDDSIADDTKPFSTLSGAYAAAQDWAAANGMVLLPPTPFSDTAGIGVSTAYAQQNGLRTLYGLRRVASAMTLGAPLEFQTSAIGLPAIEQAYGFLPASVEPVNTGDQYADLSAGTIQAAYVTTTDGQLSLAQYTLLADPRHVFGFGNVVPVATAAAISAEGPAFTATIEQVDALLSTTVIRELNAEVDLEHETPTHVATVILEDHGLLPISGS